MSIAREPDLYGTITIGASCATCSGGQGNLGPDDEAYGPGPDLSGPVEIAFFYNSNSTFVGPFGYARTMSANLYLQASQSRVVLTRGNGTRAQYNIAGTPAAPQYVPQKPGTRNTLERDDARKLWLETAPDGRVTAYPIGAGIEVCRALWVQDSVGNRHSFSYDGQSKRLTGVEDAYGRLTQLFYNADNLLQRVSDWAGRDTLFGYTQAAGRWQLTQVTGPTGCQTHYQYNADGLLNAVIDPNGFRTEYVYDAQKRVTERTLVGVGTSSYQYNADGAVFTDELGQSTKFTVDAQEKLVGALNARGQGRSITRDANGWEVARQDMTGATWQTQHNARGEVISTTDPLGHTTSYERDTWGNATRVTYADGASEQMVWGEASSAFDTTGAKRRLQKHIDALGQQTLYAYDAHGQLSSTTDALGGVTSLQYDAWGRLVGTTDALGHSVSMEYDAADNLTARIDALGRRWTYAYDSAGRMVSATDADAKMTQWGYDSNGNVVAMMDALGQRTSTAYNAFDLPQTQTDALGNLTRWEYDAAGHQISQVDALGNRTHIEFDELGQIEAIVNALGYRAVTEFDAFNRPVVKVNALSERTTLERDALSRVTATVDALGHRIQVEYDVVGRQSALTDAKGDRVQMIYDAKGQQIAVVDALGHITRVEYDALGRQVAIVDAKGNRTQMVYDAVSQLLERHDTLGAVESFGYDAVGNQVSRTDARGQLTIYSYDKTNRLLSQHSTGDEVISFTYDAMGQQLSVTDVSGTTTTAYDALGRVTETLDAGGHLLSYEYDALGRRTALVGPEGGRTLYSYDAGSQLTSLTDPQGGATLYSYDALGREVTKTLPNGVVTSHIYDAAGRETLLEARDAQNTVLSRYASVYDSAGLKTSVTELGGAVVSYGYDATDQLTREERAGSAPYLLEYAYDAAGNRTSLTRDGVTTTSTYNAANQLSGQGSLTFAYDADGNLSSETAPDGSGKSYLFDGQDQLIAVEMKNVGGVLARRSEFLYDGYGRLVKSSEFTRSGTNWVRQSEKWRVFDGMDTVQERGDADQVLAQLTRDGNIGGIVSRSSSAGASFFGYDSNGNVITLSDNNGNNVGHYCYDSFGNELEVPNPLAQENTYRFSTKELHVSSGLYYYGFRFYSPALGRWINRDPIREDGGDFNLYGFLGNNLPNKVDTYGLDAGWTNYPQPNDPYGQKSTKSIEYEPDKWNDGGIIQNSNNCYSYAWNRPYNNVPNSKPQPGGGGFPRTAESPNPPLNCNAIMALSKRDGMKNATASGNCPAGYYRAVLVLSPDDYHWYRQDSSGMWSHKPGSTEATNRDFSGNSITSPRTCDRGPYTKICGVMCVKI